MHDCGCRRLSTVRLGSEPCVSVPILENMGFWVQIRLWCWLHFWPWTVCLISYCLFAHLKTKEDNADPSIVWRLISFWSAEINRWKASSGNYFVFKGIINVGEWKRTYWTEFQVLGSWWELGRKGYCFLQRTLTLPQKWQWENCFFVILKRWEIMQR